MIVGRVFMPLVSDPIYLLPLSLAYNVLGLLVVTVIVGVVLNLMQALGGRVPYNGFTRTVDRVNEVLTLPLKRWMPPLHMGHAALDFSPLVAILVLSLLQAGLRALMGGL